MTNSIFCQADLWSAFNKLAAYSLRQDNMLMTIEKSHGGVKRAWRLFEGLKDTDIDKKLKEYQQNQNNKYADENVMFKAVQKNID